MNIKNTVISIQNCKIYLFKQASNINKTSFPRSICPLVVFQPGNGMTAANRRTDQGTCSIQIWSVPLLGSEQKVKFVLFRKILPTTEFAWTHAFQDPFGLKWFTSITKVVLQYDHQTISAVKSDQVLIVSEGQTINSRLI
jgi:hypothetical protein